MSETEGCVCVRERVYAYTDNKSSFRHLVQVKRLGEGFVCVCVRERERERGVSECVYKTKYIFSQYDVYTYGIASLRRIA